MKEGFKCEKMCQGCWSNSSTDCQFCKAYKLEDRCVDECGSNWTHINGRLTYIMNKQTRECGYCHSECVDGCTGSV